MDLVNENFSIESVSKMFDKWGVNLDWNHSFFERRPDYIVPPLAWEFGLTGTLEEITLKINDSNAGKISINSITPDISGKDGWTGKYYTDYPVTVTAKANEGYKFTGWRDGNNIVSSESVEFIIPVGGCTYEAVFEKE